MRGSRQSSRRQPARQLRTTQVAIRDPLILHIDRRLSVAREGFAARKHENADSAVRAPATEGMSNGSDDLGGEPDIALFRSAHSQYHGGTFAGRRRRWKFLAFLLCRSWWPQLRVW